MIEGKRYIKPSQAAQRLGLSRATIYRRLSKLAAAGVEIRRASERVTLVNEADLERYVTGEGPLPEEERQARLEALQETRRVRAFFRQRYGTLPAGDIDRALRELRENFGE